MATDLDLLIDARQVLADEASIERGISGPNDTWLFDHLRDEFT